jgi:hypothetical protein
MSTGFKPSRKRNTSRHRKESIVFDTYGMEQRVRGAVAEGARLRARAALWAVASVALGVMGVFFAAMGMSGRHVEGALALFAFAAAAPAAVRSYWTSRAVRRSDGRIVNAVSSYAERFASSRLPGSSAPSGAR